MGGLFMGALSSGPTFGIGATEYGLGSGLIGSVTKKSLGFRSPFGYSKKLNYFSAYMFKTIGINKPLSKRINAGPFVQVNHNIGNLMKGKWFNLLESKDKATMLGRKLQNNAMGTGSLFMGYSLGVSTSSIFDNFEEKSEHK